MTEGRIQLGILGGGQLARMMLPSAVNIGCDVHVLDPDPDCPAAPLTKNLSIGDFSDIDDVLAFGENLDLITVEIEAVSVDALKYLRDRGKIIHPAPEVIETVQDKGWQKEFFLKNKIPTAPFVAADSAEQWLQKNPFFPAVQKTRRFGYDGHGVKKIFTATDLKEALSGPSIFEEAIALKAEIAVIVVRSVSGKTICYDPVEMIFHPQKNLLDALLTPARLEKNILAEAKKIALHTATSLDVTGLLAVEMFLTQNDKILVNEVAPRPHNSGHHTLDACITSQFENHVRAILDLPLGSTELIFPAAAMFNVLGDEGFTGEAKIEGLNEILTNSSARWHGYGKTKTKPHRKMGHVTVVGDTIDFVLKGADTLKRKICVRSKIPSPL